MTPTSRAECIMILNEYRDRLTPEQYRGIEYSIGHHAIDGMFFDRIEIDRMVRLELGEITKKQYYIEVLGEEQYKKTFGDKYDE
jgi:hypothetical protein